MAQSPPVPNDDPACPCALIDDYQPVGAGAVKITGGPPDAEVHMIMFPDCPLHGAYVRDLTSNGRYSFRAGE